MLFRSGSFLAETIIPWLNGELTPEPQIEKRATFTKKIKKEDGEIDIKHGNPRENFLKIRAFDVWPIAYFFTDSPDEKTGDNDKRIRVKITDASYEDGALIIKKVIPEGRREMLYKDFRRN